MLDRIHFFLVFLRLFPFILLELVFPSQSAERKGKWGERLLNGLLRQYLGSKYRDFSDLLLPTEDGTTQIDHLLVSVYGIFVIETKNYQGKIFGKENDATWTQYFSKSKTFKFQNPLRQNYKHVRIVQETTGVELNRIHPIVVFLGLAQKLPDIPNVVKPLACIDYIRTFQTPVFTESEVGNIVARLGSVRLESNKRNVQEHVEHVQRIVQAKNQPPAIPVPPPLPTVSRTVDAPVPLPQTDVMCPRCGAEMVERTAKKGDGSPFWGCSRFPKCRGTLTATPKNEE